MIYVHFRCGFFGAGQAAIETHKTDCEALKPTTLAADQTLYGSLRAVPTGQTAIETVKTDGETP